MENVLLSASDAEKYGGQYIAIASMEDRKVVASGKDPGVVLDEAKSRGISNPILVFVPEKDAVLLFPLHACQRPFKNMQRPLRQRNII